MKKITLCFLCVLLASFTFAQKVSVTGGKFADENPTKIILNAVDGKSTKIFEVMSVLNTEGTVMGYSDGYFVPLTTSATSEKTRLLCDTPAELLLDKGAITLLAGNTTDFANKRNIKIIHQTPKGSQITRVNLNDADILSSPDFYLKPNDIIYVEPLKAKQFGFTSIPYGTIISAISLLITCLTFFAIK